VLSAMVARHSRWAASRLNGSDFALLAPRSIEPEPVVKEMQDALREVMESHNMLAEVSLPATASVYVQGDSTATLMTRLDGALIASEKENASAINITYFGDIQMMPVRDQLARWRRVLERSFQEQKFRLASYPVIASDQQLLHFEAPVRLLYEGEEFSAGTFLPWINRLELSSDLDRHVVDLALRLISAEQKPLAINLSVGALVEPAFVLWLSDHLAAAGPAAENLWLELPESMAFRHLDAFKKLAARAKTFGCKVGIEHVGHQLADIGQLHDVGLDYLKVDSAFVRNINDNAGNQTLIRTLCTIGHSIGVIVIAEGVNGTEEWGQLQELGIDGATGSAITRIYAG